MSLAPSVIAKDFERRYLRNEFVGVADAIEAAVLADRAARPADPAPSMYGITQRQRECLSFLRSWKSEVPPSFDEIRIALGLNAKSGVHRLITGLEERGLIRRLPGRARSIVVVGQEG